MAHNGSSVWPFRRPVITNDGKVYYTTINEVGTGGTGLYQYVFGSPMFGCLTPTVNSGL